MLTIDPTSVCDVCGDQYGTVCLPYLIPCGHTFCRNCLVNIHDNNPKGPACPLCRERFTLETISLVRVDPVDPLPKLSYDHFVPSDDTDSDLSDRSRSHWNVESRIREEARALELRVSTAASTKCTFEEVSELRDDIQNWLLSETKYKPNGKFPALRLSAALLRAILLNSLAYSESAKIAKSVENGLHDKIKALEHQQTVLEAENRRQKQQYSEKQHECVQLQAEVERLRRANPNAVNTSRLHSSPFPGPSPASPTSPSPSNASMQTPQARYPATSPESTPSSRLVPPRSVTTSPTRINPYAPTTLPSISSASSRSSSAASSASSSPSPTPMPREYFTPQSIRQTAPSPAPYATRPQPAKSGLETLMARTSAQPTVPRSMTAPLPPQGTPPPLRMNTRPRPAPQTRQGYPKVWLPMIDDTEETSNESTTNYSTLIRNGTIRSTATPTPTRR